MCGSRPLPEQVTRSTGTARVMGQDLKKTESLWIIRLWKTQKSVLLRFEFVYDDQFPFSSNIALLLINYDTPLITQS